jgi:TrmH family RNA methyltransferase
VIVSASAAERLPELMSLASSAVVPVTVASDAVLDALCETVTPQGIVAVVDFLDVSLEVVLEGRPQLVALLADVRDPGNAGSVVRAADAAGAAAVIFAGDSVDPYNGKVVRASVGGLFHLPIVTGVSVADAVQRLRAARMQVFVADGAGDTGLESGALAARLRDPTAWVFGNEAWGVTSETLALADVVVRIPIYGAAESLNLATAAALCLYASAGAQRNVGQTEPG